jgi:hypothetical protein
MLFNNLFTLVASASLVAALPGYGEGGKTTTTGYAPGKETSTCSACMCTNVALRDFELTLHSYVDQLQRRGVQDYHPIYQDCGRSGYYCHREILHYHVALPIHHYRR